MRTVALTLTLALLLSVVVACDQAPDGIIPESKMEKLIVDLEMADSYIGMHNEEFPNDSMRLVLKQSIFQKHGVTPEMYDSSLVWYARNMETYVKVYEGAARRLSEMRDDASKEASRMPAQPMGPAAEVHHSYAATGDTADIWQGARRWMFTSGMRSGFVTFDLKPDEEYAKGDRYVMHLKAKPVRSGMRLFLAVDYSDGATGYVNRFSCSDGWNELTLQSDSSRMVRRVYGYIFYNMLPGDIAYADSISLVRTHLDRKNYLAAQPCKVVERNKPTQATAPAQAGQAPARPAQQPAAPAAPAAPAVPSAPAPSHVTQQERFRPKEGVNKSSAQPHITNSPNAAHLPQRQN